MIIIIIIAGWVELLPAGMRARDSVLYCPYQFALIGAFYNLVSHGQETTDSLLTDLSGTYTWYIKLREIECSSQPYCFVFQLVQWGK